MEEPGFQQPNLSKSPGDLSERSSSDPKGLTESDTSQYQLLGFVLVNADNDTEERALVEGETLTLDTLGFNYNIRAFTAPGVSGVIFTGNGHRIRTDISAPFSVCGDAHGDYAGCGASSLPYGTVTLTAEAYRWNQKESTSTISMNLTIQKTAQRWRSRSAPSALRGRSGRKRGPQERPSIVPQETTSTPTETAGRHPEGLKASGWGSPHLNDQSVAQFLSASGFIGPHLEHMYQEPSDVLGSGSQSMTPKEHADVSTPRCSVQEFPCGEGDGPIEPGYVSICHLTMGRGYRQLCIPEESSKMILSSDYCGPCKGGFRIVFEQFYGEEAAEL